MSVVDLPPGIGLSGTPLGTFRAPLRARRLSAIALASVVLFAAIPWYLVARHPYSRHASTRVVLPVAFAACALLGFAVRRARVVVTRDGVRWGWNALSFAQEASRIARAHGWKDGVTLEARRGSWWVLSARDWDRFDALVRQLRRAELPIADHDRRAPLRAKLQSYGRFIDWMLVCAIGGALAVALWAA